MEIESDSVKEYARKKIEQIELIQKDLDDLKNCKYFREYLQRDELHSLIARTNALLALGTATNLLQELIGFYELTTNLADKQKTIRIDDEGERKDAS